MKHLTTFFLFVLIALFISCKKDNKEPKERNEPPIPTDYLTKEVQVVLPKPGIDLATCKLMSYSAIANLDGQGKGRAAYMQGTPTIGYVLDKDDQLLLAGFITDSNAVINTESTAKLLLYFAYRVPLQPYNVTDFFVNHINEVSGVTAWYKQFDSLFTANPLTLTQGSFVEPLKKRMEEFTKNNSVDIRAQKAADITVNDGNVRSGLQVAPEGLSKFTVTHTYRRRAYAFLYKKSYKNLNGVTTNITNYDANGEEFKIDPASGVTSLSGEAGKAIEGKLNESASVVIGPKDMKLEDNESEAKYILRIVGPGFGGNNASPKTKPEQDQLSQLEMETFAFDFLLPVIMEISGNKDAIKKSGINMGDGPTEAFLDKAEAFVKAFPDVYEEMKDGNFTTALKKGLVGLATNTGQKYFKELILAATGIMYASATKAGVNVPNLTISRAEEIIKSPLAVLKVVDLILFSTDLIRITANITSSRQMEEWELTARGANVTLSPEERSVVPFQQAKVTATIKNFTAPEGTHAFFEWKTSGKFGKLTDTKGHSNLAEFNSEDADVFYVSKASSSALSDGDNIDYIYVTAYYGTTKVGSDTVTVNVQKDKYKITPEGLTVSGKKDNVNEVTLYLEKTKGWNSIEANDSLDYKVVWTIGGKYGKLSGRDIYTQNSITQYNDNWIIYECLDDKTKEAVENVQAKIYRKAKSEPESAYLLFDEAEGTVKINNDEKKKIIVVNVTYTKKILTPSVGNWAVFPTAKFPVEADATKYSVKLFDFTGTFVSPPEGRVYTWDVGKLPPTPYNIYPETFDVDGGQVYMVFGRTWCGGRCDESGTETWITNYKKGYGSPKAEVTYYLK